MLRQVKWPSTKTCLALVAVAALGIFSAVGLILFERRSPEERARSYYEHALKLIEQHDNAKAAIELHNALQLKGDMLPAWRIFVQLEEAARHWDDVIHGLRAIVELDPTDLKARLKLGKLLLLRGAFYEALKLTDAGIEADGRNAKLLGLRAAILYKLNNNSGAVRQAQAALSIDPGNADARVVLAADRMANDDPKGALQLLKNEGASDIEDLGIQLFKLKIFEKLDDTQQFETLLRSLADRYPEEISLRQQLIKFYVDQHREAEAEREARAIVEKNPANSDAELALVRLLYTAQGPAAAKQELDARINAGGDVFPYQLALAELDFAQGRFVDSERQTQKLVSQAATTTQALAAQIELAEIYVERNKIDAAEAVVAEILHKEPRNTDGLRLRAAVRMARGQVGLAIADLQQALNDQPRSTELMLLLGLAYERNGSVELAEKQYAEAMRTANFDPMVGLSYAGVLRRRGSTERAEETLTELSRRSPKNLAILSALAQAKLARGDWLGAQAIAKSIRAAGDTGDADLVQGATFLGQRKFDQSIAAFRSAVDADPGTAQPMVALVSALVRAQETDKATDFLKSTLQAHPDNVAARVLMGSVQLAEGARDEAEKSFKLAIEKQPKNGAGYQVLANFYVGEKQFDQALAVIHSGIQVQPDDMVLHLELAVALEKTGQYEAAIAEYEAMLSQHPGSMIAANNLASLLADHRSDKASLERAQSLAESLRGSEVPQFKDTLGWISYRRNDYRTAVSLLEEAAAARPNVALVHYHLAMSYMAARQSKEASEQLKAALALSPDGELEEKIEGALKKLGT